MGETGRTGGNPSFCYCKRSAKENNNTWTKVNDAAFTQKFKAGMEQTIGFSFKNGMVPVETGGELCRHVSWAIFLQVGG